MVLLLVVFVGALERIDAPHAEVIRRRGNRSANLHMSCMHMYET